MAEEFVMGDNAFQDKSVFVESYFAFCVLAKDFSGMGQNCVNFEDFAFDYSNASDIDAHPGQSIGVYDLEEKIALSLYFLDNNIFFSLAT